MIGESRGIKDTTTKLTESTKLEWRRNGYRDQRGSVGEELRGEEGGETMVVM